MKRTAALLFVSLMILSAGVLAQDAAKVDPEMYVKYSAGSSLVGFVPDEFVVCLKSSVAVDHAGDALSPVALSRLTGFAALATTYRVSKLGPQFVGSDRGLAAVTGEGRRLARYYKVKFAQGTLGEAMAAYAKNPLVDHVEPIGIHTVSATPNDPSYPSQWHLNQTNDHDMDAPEAWEIETGKTTVIVAILDTGVRYFHKDLGGVNASYSNVAASRGNMWINSAEKNGVTGVDDDGNGYIDDWIGYDFVNGATPCWTGEDCNTKDNDPRDFNGHGTHCAGNVGALNNNGYASASPSGGWGNGTQQDLGNGVKVMACRVGWSGSSSGSEVGYVRMDFCAEGFYYAANNGARIASCSWGSSNSGGIGDAVTYFVAHGGLVFKAAGNDGTENADYLCARSDVISVAATDANDCKASFSTYGTWVDISAPGVNILSLYHVHSDPTNDYVATVSGTSMATPLSASVGALIWSRNPSWTAAQVKAQLFASADNIDGISCNSAYAGKLGAGRVNAYKAVNSISITVNSPAGGEVWNVGTQHLISWSMSGVVPDSINIYLSIDSGAHFNTTVAHGLSGVTTSYNWTVPNLPVSTSRIKVVAYVGGGVGGSGQSLTDFTIKGYPRRYAKKTGGNVFPYSIPEWAARNIQDAVNAATVGDTIVVAAGTYTNPITVNKAVYLYGGWDTTFATRNPAAHVTTINCSGSNVSFMNIASGTCGVEGFTLTFGTGTAAAIPFTASYGGAVFSYLSSPIIRHNKIVSSGYADALTLSLGGGIACYGGTPLIEWNTLTGCASQSGGGIYLYQTNATLRHNVITGSAPSPDYSGNKVGGGIYAYQTTITLENNKIYQNDGYKKGGGIYAYIGSVSSTSDTVSANDCSQTGGGLYVERAPLTLAHAIVRQNTCGSSNGGGLFYHAGNLNMSHSLIALNNAGVFGGGIYADSAYGSAANNTLDRNVATYGGNVYLRNPAPTLTFKNNIMTYGADYGFQATSMANVLYKYNNCYGNSPANYDTVVPDATNISGNPVYADTATVDYHLGVSSASIDAGDPAGGNDPDGSRADQGAYGGVGAATAAPEYVKNLSASAVNDTTIQLTWDPTLEDATYYAVYGSKTTGFTPGTTTLIGTATVPAHTFQHKPVAGCWFYRVNAVNALGHAGGYAAQATACAAGPDTTPPTVHVVYPNGGEHIVAGSAVLIKWHASDDRQVDSVSIYYSKNGGLLYYVIAHGSTADSTFNWVTPAISSDSVLVKVVAYDHAKLTGFDVSDALFSIRVTTAAGDLPAVNALHQNFPNPFNPATRIAYSVSAATHVSLKIYDSSGRLVRELVNATVPAGRHEALWDGKDRVGRTTASGIYFYRFEAGSFTQTKKMVLVR